jgi:hypothetical protein
MRGRDFSARPNPRPAKNGSGSVTCPRTATSSVPVLRLQAATAGAGPAPHERMSADMPLKEPDGWNIILILQDVKQS